MIALSKSVTAVLAALIVAFAMVVVVEAISAIMHPFPPGFDPSDIEACKAHVANYPTPALIVAGVGWVVTVFISCWIATRLGAHRHPAHGVGIGLLLLALAAFNMWMLPYPLWFEAAMYVLFPLAIVAGSLLGRGRRQPAPAAV